MPSIINGSVMFGKTLSKWIVCTPEPGMLNWIVCTPAVALAYWIAARSEPVPLSSYW